MYTCLALILHPAFSLLPRLSLGSPPPPWHLFFLRILGSGANKSSSSSSQPPSVPWSSSSSSAPPSPAWSSCPGHNGNAHGGLRLSWWSYLEQWDLVCSKVGSHRVHSARDHQRHHRHHHHLQCAASPVWRKVESHRVHGGSHPLMHSIHAQKMMDIVKVALVVVTM